MPTPRGWFAVGVVSGVLYAVGGSFAALHTNEAYDPITNRWTSKAPVPTWRVSLAVGVVNGVLYAVGGEQLDIGYNLVAANEAYQP